MKDCPQCFAPVDGVACRQCGFRDPAAGPAPRAIDPDHRRCTFVDQNGRCPELGRVAINGAPLQCWAHAMPSWHAWSRGTIPDSFHTAKAALRRAKPGPKPFDFEEHLERSAIQDEGRKP